MAIVDIDWNPPRRILRNFGLIAVAAFGTFGALVFWQIGPFGGISAGAAAWTAGVLWVLALYCGAVAVVAPGAVRPVYLLLTVATYPIGFVLSHLVMAVVFYLVITPVGLVFKIMGRDSMNRRFDPSATTYWIKRRPPDNLKRYFRQF
jgi:hypothetical protein